jgi:aminoglycoside phosphotransferase (APT) family kinase protein
VNEPWEAEVVVTPELASSLIVSQFPQFAGAPVEPIGEGWDNAAFLAGDRFVFRFPRRAIAAPLLENEIRTLPAIAGNLSLPIPSPVHVGAPQGGYPWRFAGYERLRGGTLCSADPSAVDLAKVAAQLGAFLRALHAIDPVPLVALGLPPDTIGRLDHADRMPKVAGRIAELVDAGLLRDEGPLLKYLEAIAPAGSRAMAVVHGDLYARHVLVDGRGASGIIDWGDLHCGDPAVDVSVMFEVLPANVRDNFLDAYGPIDAETMALARYRAIYHAALVAHYGYRIGDAALVRIGLTGLEQSRS